MSFLYGQLLTFGLPLVALPIVIHLINLRRRKRVEWAAMDFLLASQKRSRNWILLQQLLLMLARTAAIAAVVLMLAGPTLRSEWGALLSGGRTHHLVLLDDSYSMSDAWAGEDTFAEAKDAVVALFRDALGEPGAQEATIVRFSDVQSDPSLDEPWLPRTALSLENLDTLRTRFSELAPAESDAGPGPALTAAAGLIEPNPDESSIVYVFSDFRRRQWSEGDRLEQQISSLEEQTNQVHLVQCGEGQHPNLTVASLEPEAGGRATGVETWFRAGVTNHGPARVPSVLAEVRQDGRDLPAIDFGAIAPGETVERRFRVVFRETGWHSLRVAVEGDAVAADNARYYTCETPDAYPVLVIDGSPDRVDSFYLRKALDPGGKGLAGWAPVVETPSYLRNADDLDRYAAVFLLDAPTLDGSAVERVEAYASAGGGVALFLGPSSQAGFLNERLYRGGRGLLPAPVDRPVQLLSDPLNPQADIVVSDAPVFRVFSGQRNSFLALARVNLYYGLRADWQLADDSAVKLLASLRNRAPLVLEKPFGDGVVIAQYTRLSPAGSRIGPWNNWAANPAFPIYINELVGALSANRRGAPGAEAGKPLTVEVDPEQHTPLVQVFAPGGSSSTAQAKPDDAGRLTATLSPRPASGVWRAELTSPDGKTEQRLIAVNVEPNEGDLNRLSGSALAAAMPDANYRYALAKDFRRGEEQLAGYGLGDALLYALIAVIALEQWLAYRTGYHSG